MISTVMMGDTKLASGDKSFLLFANFLVDRLLEELSAFEQDQQEEAEPKEGEEDEAKDDTFVGDGLPGPLEHDEVENVSSFALHLLLVVLVVVLLEVLVLVNDVQEVDRVRVRVEQDADEDEG